MESQPKRLRVGILLCAAAVGAGFGGAALAGAATNGSSPATSATATAETTAPDPAAIKQGPAETLLTGDTAEKVKAAALAAVPGGTIIRVETDSEGSPYEAHVKKADGTQVTVKLDADFKVTGIEEGCGRGPGGRHGPRDAESSSTSAT